VVDEDREMPEDCDELLLSFEESEAQIQELGEKACASEQECGQNRDSIQRIQSEGGVIANKL